jgi:2-phosphosulfolactate phosphatase
MQIEVIASVNDARSDDLSGRTVLVIDVLRATSNMVTGLAHGCAGILPVETVQQAKAVQEPGDLLGGERNCKRLSGFDIGNSPFEYMDSMIKGKRICMTTTNGTRAIQKTQRAHTVIACSFLNITAAAEATLGIGKDVYILCAGTQDVFSLEDGLCAGLAVEELSRLAGASIACNDLGLALQNAVNHSRGSLKEVLLASSNGKRLTKLGFRADVEYCSLVNVYPLVPVMHNGLLVSSGIPLER